jgi:hypothetical protein
LNLNHANTWTAKQTFGYASSTGISASYASSTNAFFGALSVGNLSGILKATTGLISAASAGIDYENPLTFAYPLTRSVNAISLAFGTTTQNFWSAYNNFSSLFATNASSTNATTTSFGINGETFTDLTGAGLQNIGGALTLNATGDWTGTFDGQEGSYYLANSFSSTSAAYFSTQYQGATTTLSTSGVLSFNANPVVFGSSPITLSISQSGTGASGYLSSTDFNTFNNKIGSSSLSAAFPLAYNSSTGAFTYGGLSTSTAVVVGNIPYFSGANTFANVATSSVSSGTGISFTGTPGSLVGGTVLTITNTGVTSLAGTANQITASAATGVVTLSVPNRFIFPNSYEATYGTTTYASSTGFSASYASSTNAFFGNLSIGTLTGLLKGANGVVSTAIAGTDYVAGGAGAATTTLSFTGPFTLSATPVVFGSSPITSTYYGLATTTALSSSGVLYSTNGAAGVSSAATSTPTAVDLTISGSGATIGALQILNPYAIATTSGITQGGLSYYTQTSGKTTIGSVATTTVTAGNGLTGSITTLNSGGASNSLGLAAIAANTVLANNTSGSAVPTAIATSTFFGTGSGGQVLTWNNGVPQWVASTTYTAGSGISTSFALGALTITNTGLITYDAFTHPAAGQSATTSLMLFNGNASSTQISATQAYFGGTATSTFTNAGFLGIGTSTPRWGLQLASSTAPQLVLSAGDATQLPHVSFRNAGGNLYIGTTSATTYATSSDTSILTLIGATSTNQSGFVGIGSTSPWAQLSINGNGLLGGAPQFAVGSSTNTSFVITNDNKIGIGTSTPYATLSLQVATGSSRFLFNISSSSAGVATTSIFSVNNIGSTTLFRIPSTVLTTDLNGTIVGTTSLGIAYGGTGTTTAPVSQLLYGGTGGVYQSVGTSTVTCSGIVSCTAFSVVGAGSTITSTGLASYDAWTHPNTLGYSATTSVMGIGTTTPKWGLTISSSTAPQLTLTDASLTASPFNFRVINSKLYISTSSPTTFATTSSAFFTVDNSTGSTTLLKLDVTGSATSSFIGNGINITAGCFAVNNTCVGGSSGLSSYDAWTHPNTLGYSATTSVIGIGTTTPQWMLTASSSTAPQLTLTDASLTNAPYNFRTVNGNFYLSTSSPTTFATSTLSAISVLSSGKVGIGNNTPLWNFVVGTDTNTPTANPSTISLGATYGNNTPGNEGNLKVILFDGGSGSRYGLGVSGGTLEYQSPSGGAQVWYSGGGNERGRLTSAGDWGIGTGTPQWRLTVASSTGPQLALTDASATQSPWTFRSINGNLYIATSSVTTFATSSDTRLAISSSGSVGIGTAAPSSTYKLDVSGLGVRVLNTGSVTLGTDAGRNMELTASGATDQYIDMSNGEDYDFRLLSSSATNSFSLSASTTANILVATALGNIGIGTTSPFGLLSVSGGKVVFKSTASTTAAFAVENNYGLNTFQVDTFDTSNNIFEVATSTGTAYFDITRTGNVGIGSTSPASLLTVVGGGVCISGTGASVACGNTAGTLYYRSASAGTYDVAENYLASDLSLAPGKIAALDLSNNSTITTAGIGGIPFGVISTAPGLLLGGSDSNANMSRMRSLALSGRVPVAVNHEGGDIFVGDAVTLSHTPGVGMKATTTTDIIGFALEPYNGHGTSTIEVFVRSEFWFAPQDRDALSALLQFGHATGTASTTVATGSFMDTFIKGMLGQINTWLATATNGIGKLFAGEVHTDKICVKKADGSEFCANGDQLQQMVAGAAAAPAPGGGSTPPPPPPPDGGTGSTTPPADGGTGSTTLPSDTGGTPPPADTPPPTPPPADTPPADTGTPTP